MLRRRRERAARDWSRQAFLKREIADRLVERLDDVRRTFPLALDLGSQGDEIASTLGERKTGGCLVRADLGEGFPRRARGPAVVAEETFLPFAAHSFDLGGRRTCAPRHVAARRGNLQRAIDAAVRPGRGELRGAFPARLGAA